MSDQLEQLLRTELAPELEVKRQLGRGSMASVFLAREPALKRMVAIKVLRPDAASDDTARRRFEREAQAAARLNHRSLTDIYRIGRLRLGVPYIVMEYIDGRNLADALKANGPFSVADVRDILRSVAEGLAAAHAKGIIHRDVRPANVIREDPTGRAVLTDFGIAALLESGGDTGTTRLTTMGHRIGNPRYMSPEQLDGEPLTVQSDVYSLGVLGYELLTGEGPYAGTGAAVIVAQAHSPPRRIADMRPDVDSRLAMVLERCLSRNPAHRPRASEIAAALSPDGEFTLSTLEAKTHLGMFLDELRRRRVWTVGGAYGAAAIVIIQTIGDIAEQFTMASFVPRAIIIAALAGFPITLSLAWMYDIREGRVRRTAASDDIGADSSRRMLLPLLGLAFSVVLAVIVGLWAL
jgi:serine/threonine protein kinase